MVLPSINKIKFLNFIEIKNSVLYGNKQQTTLQEECAKVLERCKGEVQLLFEWITRSMEKLREDIEYEDREYIIDKKELETLQLCKQKNKNAD